MPLIGIGDGTTPPVSGPKFTCPDGVTQVISTSDCPGGTPSSMLITGAPTPAEQQIQAEIDALYAYTQAGQQPGGAGMPTGSTPVPAAPATDWGAITLVIAAAAVVMMMARR